MRVEKPLELQENTWKTLELIQTKLGHDSLEETLTTLIALGSAAISVTTKDDRTVRLLSSAKLVKESEPCAKCGQRRVVSKHEVSIILGAT